MEQNHSTQKSILINQAKYTPFRLRLNLRYP